MPPASHQLSFHRPPNSASSSNFMPMYLPSPTQSQAPGASMESILNASLSRGLPPPGRSETERERKEREQWEIERYGRVQYHNPDYGWKRKL